MKIRMHQVVFLFAVFAAFAQHSVAQSTDFIYQGRLLSGSVPANGNHDFEFSLWDAQSGGSQIGSTVTKTSVNVNNGAFSVQLDFGNQFPGASRYLEIRVRVSGNPDFNSLTPRQPISSTPYAIKSLNSDSATNATNAVNATTATNAQQLGGVAANQYVVTTDARMTDARNPLPGSTNYIQNTTTQQVASNFNVSATGKANIFDATTQYNLGGTRVLSNPGTANQFVGAGAGAGNTTGNNNSFFGSNAGGANTAGSNNSFFGSGAGRFSTGANNAFFGTNAGDTNTIGLSNTIIGVNADVAANNLDHATAIGADATVSSSSTIALGRAAGLDTVQVPGGLTVTGTFIASGASITNLNASNISSGTLDSVRLGVVPIANGGTGSATKNFVDLTTAQSIAGNKTFSDTLTGNTVNTFTQYNIDGNRILSNDGTNNLIAGVGAGAANTGSNNSFFGKDSGAANTSGQDNSFFGRSAGLSNTTGQDNSFFGRNAGFSNSTAGNNSFFGFFAGNANTGASNSFFGSSAGASNTTGGINSFFGASAGNSTTSGDANSFFGESAGKSNSTGNDNSFFGRNAGTSNTTGSNNTIVGYNANVGSTNLDHATAIGADATVSTSNTIALGRSAGVDAVRVNGTLTVVNYGLPTATNLCVNSNVLSVCSSSARYKSNILSLTVGLNIVSRLRPVTFDWKQSNQKDLGLIAEEVEGVDPLLVTYNTAGEIQGVKYDQLTVVLINAVKQQQAQIESQQKQISQLLAQMRLLRSVGHRRGHRR